MNKKRNVAIYVYDNAEVLDFAGPFEVFSVTAELNNDELFQVYVVAEEERMITAVNGLLVMPHYTIHTCPPPDILVIAGGVGSRQQIQNPDVLAWVQRVAQSGEVVMSVCSGALILGKAGLLDNLPATTHHEVFDVLAQVAPTATLCPDDRFVDNGRIITTGGISAGIDGSFHVVQRLYGTAVAQKTAQYMEYDWMPPSN